MTAVPHTEGSAPLPIMVICYWGKEGGPTLALEGMSWGCGGGASPV